VDLSLAVAKDIGELTGLQHTRTNFLSGAYYRLGDSLQFQARIVNAQSGTSIRVVDPVTGSIERPLVAIEALREKA
jgi:hypothetical protein